MIDRYGADAGEPPPRPPFFRRLWMILFQPADLFRALADNPAWFPMAAFVAAIVGVAMVLTPAEAFHALAARMPTDPSAAAPGTAAMVYKWMAVVSSSAVMLFLPLILSLITYVIFVFMRGDRATLRQHLCVLSHAGVITALGVLLVTPLRARNLDFEETLALGDFVPFLDGFLLKVLNGMDLFSIWAAVVAGLGLSLLDERRGWAPTAAVLVGLLAVMAVVVAFFTP